MFGLRGFLARNNEAVPFLALVFSTTAAAIGFAGGLGAESWLLPPAPADMPTMMAPCIAGGIFGMFTAWWIIFEWDEPDGWRLLLVRCALEGLWLGVTVLPFALTVFQEWPRAMIVGITIAGGVAGLAMVSIVGRGLEKAADWLEEPVKTSMWIGWAVASCVAGIVLAKEGQDWSSAAGYGCLAFIGGVFLTGLTLRVFGWRAGSNKQGFLLRLHKTLEAISKIHGGAWSVVGWLIVVAMGAGIAAGASWLIWWWWPAPRVGRIEQIESWIVIGVAALVGWSLGVGLIWSSVKSAVAALAGVTKRGAADVHGTADVANVDEAAEAARGRRKSAGSAGLNLDY